METSGLDIDTRSDIYSFGVRCWQHTRRSEGISGNAEKARPNGAEGGSRSGGAYLESLFCGDESKKGLKTSTPEVLFQTVNSAAQSSAYRLAGNWYPSWLSRIR